MTEIKSIFDMNVDDFRIKLGDIKVDSEDLRIMLRYVQQYHVLLSGMYDELASQDQKLIQQGLQFTEFFQNKYIVLSELRLDQNFYYDILQKLKDEDYIKGHSADEIDSLRREIWGMYVETKAKREKLQKELGQLKKQMETEAQTC